MRKPTGPSKRRLTRRISHWLLLFVTVLGLSGVAHGALPLTIITLQHRSVGEVLPALRPMLAPEGQLSGINDKLLIRTTPDNLRVLRDVLGAIDTPPARLRIEVRSDRSGSEQRFDAGVGGEIKSGDVGVRFPGQVSARGARIEIGSVQVGVNESTRSEHRGSTQFVETRDGGTATLFVGTAEPLAFRQVFIQPNGARVVRGTIYRDVGQGVSVRPTVVGQRVRLVLSPEASALANDGRIEVMRLETEVEGRLGEWIAVGGATTTGADTESRGVAIGSTSSADTQSHAAFWVRVTSTGAVRD
ncbi:MAG: hypothetical protein FHP92_18555 [Denitromonas halophila]|nr:MAG: hypothetical protein FHP92_18555 [Denitromonas halophila]